MSDNEWVQHLYDWCNIQHIKPAEAMDNFGMKREALALWIENEMPIPPLLKKLLGILSIEAEWRCGGNEPTTQMNEERFAAIQEWTKARPSINDDIINYLINNPKKRNIEGILKSTEKGKSLSERITDFLVNANRTIGKKDLLRKFQSFKAADIAAAIDDLSKADIIETEIICSSPIGRPATTYKIKQKG